MGQLKEMTYDRQMADEEIADLIDRKMDACMENDPEIFPATLGERLKLHKELFDSFRRLDILQELVDDPRVTEIMVNGPDQVFVETGGKIGRWEKSFESREQLEDLIQQIVTGDITDLVAVHLLFLGHSLQSVHSAGDIHAAGIGDDADLLFIGLFADLFHQADEISGVTGSGILHLLTLHDRQSQLRQIVASHVIQVAVTNHVDSSVRTVAPETLSASNGYFLHS